MTQRQRDYAPGDLVLAEIPVVRDDSEICAGTIVRQIPADDPGWAHPAYEVELLDGSTHRLTHRRLERAQPCWATGRTVPWVEVCHAYQCLCDFCDELVQWCDRHQERGGDCRCGAPLPQAILAAIRAGKRPPSAARIASDPPPAGHSAEMWRRGDRD